jgi:hypothetical protein
MGVSKIVMSAVTRCVYPYDVMIASSCVPYLCMRDYYTIPRWMTFLWSNSRMKSLSGNRNEQYYVRHGCKINVQYSHGTIALSMSFTT